MISIDDPGSSTYDRCLRTVLTAWSQVLGGDVPDADADFFASGGQSLSALLLARALVAAERRDVTARDVFRAPTPARLAGLICERPVRAAAPPGTTGGSRHPIAMAQERFWQMEQIVPGAPFVIGQARLDWDGEVDTGPLIAALHDVARRHEVLRSRFVLSDDGPQQVVDDFADVEVIEVESRDGDVEALFDPHRRIGFLVGERPLFRVVLVHRPGGIAMLLLAHHLIFDGESRGIFFRDLVAAYAARCTGSTPDLPPLTMQFGPFSSAQRRQFDGEVLERYLRYWERCLGDVPPVAFADAGSVAGVARFESESSLVTLPSTVWTPLVELGAREGATGFMALFALFGATLSLRFGLERVAVSTLVANRDVPEVADLIGNFANVIPVVVDCSGDPTFRGLLGRTRMALLDAYDHQDLPFDHVAGLLDERGRVDPAPLLRVGLALQPRRSTETVVAGTRVSLAPARKKTGDEVNPSTFDLTLELRESGGGLDGAVLARTAVLPRAEVKRIIVSLASLGASVTASPDVALSELAAERTA